MPSILQEREQGMKLKRVVGLVRARCLEALLFSYNKSIAMKIFDSKKIDWLWLAGLLLCSITIYSVSNLLFIFWDFDLFPYMDQGKIAHYYINYYDFGFVKRGLVASLIQTFGHPTVAMIHYTGYVMGLAVCGLGSYLIWKMRDYFGAKSYILFTAFLMFNSGTFTNLGYDLGRFDQLLIICSIASLYFIRQGALIKLIAVSIAALLIHEMYIILFFPLLLYVAVYHSEFKWGELGGWVLSVGLVMVFLFFFGKIEGKSVEQIANTIDVEGFQFWKSGIIWTRTLGENLSYTSEYISGYSPEAVIRLVFGAVYTLLTLILLTMISTYNKMDWYGFGVILLAGLAIFILAIDYSRWYSLIIINSFLYFGFCTLCRGESGKGQVVLTKPHMAIMSLLLIAGLILGPIGIMRAFPLFKLF